ncbi:hypothetical protein E3J79_04025 [Candidatus Dependentiae bacterium]|nr:MAG: hypothetical protein E3J79_04025 [Candidatus Dependentiae bacterium]
MMRKQWLSHNLILWSITICSILLIPTFSYTFIDQTYSFCKTPNYFNKVLLMGSIQYPHTIAKVPTIRIYCGGNKIKPEINDENKKLTFALPIYRYQTSFYLLFTETIDFETEENVVLYLKIPKNTLYKLYTVEQTKISQTPTEKNNEISATDKTEQQKSHYNWLIKENMLLKDNGRIPDNALIICVNPTYITGLEEEGVIIEGTSALELPKIIIRNDLLELVGSEETIHELSTKLLLSLLDCDAIHASIPQEINHRTQTIVALAT